MVARDNVDHLGSVGEMTKAAISATTWNRSVKLCFPAELQEDEYCCCREDFESKQTAG